MSRVTYQFVTASQTSWTHSVQCDLCKLKVTRVGELPTSENGSVPLFEHGALAGWSSFSMRSPRPPADQPDLEQDLWPRLDRDLCPSCANVVNDWLCSIGADIAKNEEWYLDALGRPTTDKPTYDGPGVSIWEAGLVSCPACSDRTRGPRYFTQQQLESHAVEQHRVRFVRNLPNVSLPAGWCTELQNNPRVYFGDVQSALNVEVMLREAQRVREEHERERYER